MTDDTPQEPLTPDATSSSLRRTAEEIARLKVDQSPKRSAMMRDLAAATDPARGSKGSNIERELARISLAAAGKGEMLQEGTLEALRKQLDPETIAALSSKLDQGMIERLRTSVAKPPAVWTRRGPSAEEMRRQQAAREHRQLLRALGDVGRAVREAGQRSVRRELGIAVTGAVVGAAAAAFIGLLLAAAGLL